MNNITKTIIATACVASVIIGGVIINSKESKESNKKVTENNNLNEQVLENNEYIFETVNIDITQNENYSAIYTIKNISNKDIKRANIKIADYMYELFDIRAGESTIVKAYEATENDKIDIISIEYKIFNYNFEELSIQTSVKDSKLTRNNKE